MVLIQRSLLALFPQCSFAWYPSYATGPDGLNYPYPQPQTVGDDWRGKELQQAMAATQTAPQTVTYQAPPAYPGAPPTVTYETVTYHSAPSVAAPTSYGSAGGVPQAPAGGVQQASNYYGAPVTPAPTMPQPDSNQCMPSQYPLNAECASLPDDSHPPVEPYVANHNKNPGVTRHRRDQYRGGKPTERPSMVGRKDENGKGIGRKKGPPTGDPNNYYYADGGDAPQEDAPPAGGGGKAPKGGDADADASGKGGKDGKLDGKDGKDGGKGGKDGKKGGKDGKDGKKGGKDAGGASGGKPGKDGKKGKDAKR